MDNTSFTVYIIWGDCCLLYSYFIPVWGIVETTATRCGVQLDALLPRLKGRGQLYIKLSMAPRGSSFVYSSKQPWNNCLITQQMRKRLVFSPRTTSLIGTLPRDVQCHLCDVWCLQPGNRQNCARCFCISFNRRRHDHGIVDCIDRLVTHIHEVTCMWLQHMSVKLQLAKIVKTISLHCI